MDIILSALRLRKYDVLYEMIDFGAFDVKIVNIPPFPNYRRCKDRSRALMQKVTKQELASKRENKMQSWNFLLCSCLLCTYRRRVTISYWSRMVCLLVWNKLISAISNVPRQDIIHVTWGYLWRSWWRHGSVAPWRHRKSTLMLCTTCTALFLHDGGVFRPCGHQVRCVSVVRWRCGAVVVVAARLSRLPGPVAGQRAREDTKRDSRLVPATSSTGTVHGVTGRE